MPNTWLYTSGHVPTRLGEGVQTPTSLGMGFNSFIGDFANRAIPNNPVASQSLRVVQYHLKEIDNLRKLRTELRLSASATFGGMGASFSAELSVFNSARITQHSTYLLVRASIQLDRVLLDTPTLTDTARDLLHDQGETAFWSIFGNMYVRQVVRGGEIYLLKQFHSNSQREMEDIRASISAIHGTFEGEAEYSKRMSTLRKYKSTELDMKWRGGALDIDVGGGFDAVVNKVLETVEDSPSELEFGYQPYTNTLNRPDVPLPLTLEERMEDLESLADIKEDALVLRSDLQFAMDNTAQFEAFDANVVRGNINALNGIVEQCDVAARCIISNPLDQGCRIPEVTWENFEGPSRLEGDTPGTRVGVQFRGGPWVHVDNGKWTPVAPRGLTHLQIRLRSAESGLSVRYRGWFGSGFGSGRSDEVRSWEHAHFNDEPLTAIEVRLSGAQDRQYSVLYDVELSDGTKDRARNGGVCGNVREGDRIVKRLRVWLEPR